MQPSRPFVVSIYAPSGSGKSQLAKQTAGVLGEIIASRVAVDNFFVPRPAEMPREVFDHLPLRYDWMLLTERLALPIDTKTSAPGVDFETFFRRAETGGPAFTGRPVMLLDAMEPFPDANARILLVVPYAIRLERIAERDLRWGSNVRERTGHLDATWERVLAMGIVPDLILDGLLPLEQNAQTLAAWIDEHMDDARTA